jgi:hypothetical protein
VACSGQALRDVAGKTPRNWIFAISGILLLALPILAFCGATIYTLHSEEARAAMQPLPASSTDLPDTTPASSGSDVSMTLSPFTSTAPRRSRA